MQKKVLYLGNSETYFLFNDVAQQTETTLVPFYAVTADKQTIIDETIKDNYEVIIFNVAEIITAADDILEIISAIEKSVKSKLIVMAQGYSEKSHIIIESAKCGVGFFILSRSVDEVKQVYINTLANVKNVGDIIDVMSLKSNVTPKISDDNFISAAERFTSKSVGVAGCMTRIGTTSVAIQLIKLFQSKGKTACYIDTYNTEYVKQSMDYYCADEMDEENHRVNFDGVDMYYDITTEIMEHIYLKNYDFMVYDCGDISGNTLKQTTFLQNQYRLLCCGSKPNENIALHSLLKSIYKTNISYMYFAVPQNERQGVIDDVAQLNQKCYFVPFFDDCFSLSLESAEMFSLIFADEFPKTDTTIPQKNKKRSFFSFRKNKQEGVN